MYEHGMTEDESPFFIHDQVPARPYLRNEIESLKFKLVEAAHGEGAVVFYSHEISLLRLLNGI
jgi:hypothetical protein